MECFGKAVHSQWEEVIILLFVFLVQLIPISEPKKAFQFSSFYAAFLTCLFFLNLQNHIESQIMFLPFIRMKPLGEDGGIPVQ